MRPSRRPPFRRSRRSAARHRAVVALVIVAEQVQQAMEREHPELGRVGVARRPRLPPRHAPWR